MRAYEGLFIFDESVSEEDLGQILERIDGEMKNLSGGISGTERLGRYSFARPTKKRAAGRYVRVTFELDELKMGELLARCKLNPDVFRVQIVRHDSLPEPQAVVEEAETSGVAE